MNKILIAIVTLLCMSSVALPSQSLPPASQSKVVRKIKIRSADPYLIMMLLQGKIIIRPETSTINNTGK